MQTGVPVFIEILPMSKIIVGIHNIHCNQQTGGQGFAVNFLTAQPHWQNHKAAVTLGASKFRLRKILF